MKRLYSLDVFRLIMAYVIVLLHGGIEVKPGATVCVELFFIMSGYFLARKHRSKKDTQYNQWDYTLDHVKSLYPHYLFSMLVFILYMTAREVLVFIQSPSFEKVRSMLETLYNQIPAFMFLQTADHYHGSYNGPMWQISATLIAGYFVYGLLSYNEKLSKLLIFPAGILMTRSIIRAGYNLTSHFGPFFMPLLFAFSGLCIGVLTFEFTETKLYAAYRSRSVIFNLLPILAIVCIFYFGEYDVMHLILAPFIIWGCMEENSWINWVFQRKVFSQCGKLYLVVYMNHMLMNRFTFARVIPRLCSFGIQLNEPHQRIIYILIVTLFSIFAIWFVDKIQMYISKYRNAHINKPV